jgi:hypothetical protein
LHVLEDYITVTYKDQNAKVEAMTWTFEAKTKVKDTHVCALRSFMPRLVIDHYITDGVIKPESSHKCMVQNVDKPNY